jgi:lysophospholipase L1-like esterase|tara:strand:+ start:6424 stop:7713 length:1290 start_codon:yes stop_codon:yes gene_type:complete
MFYLTLREQIMNNFIVDTSRKSARQILFITLPLFVTTLFLAGDLGAQTQDDERWVTTWTASPSTMAPMEQDSEALQDQTIRLITHTSVGGSSLRIRLANYHGEQAIDIGRTAIALQSEGSSIQIGTSTAITFGGEDSVRIPRGGVIISDPIRYLVPPLSNLSVSLYLPNDTGFVTAHSLSNQTNYTSLIGDYTTSAELSNAKETPAWSLLTAIDVIDDTGISAIATVGDSITDGWGSSLSGNQRWPNHFARRLFADESIDNYAVINAGISGNRVTSEGNVIFGQNLQARFERDVLALSDVTHMVLMEGINDIGMPTMEGSAPTPAADIIAGYRQIINRAHMNEIKIIGATLTPFQGAVYFTPEGEIIRQAVNQFIRSSGEFDGVIDFDKVVQDPNNPIHLLPAFTEDNLHPNDAGYAVMADAIDLNLFR